MSEWSRLDGQRFAVSAHKWLFQPKESALVLFRHVEKAHAAISFGGAYLAVPNIGVLGSHGAMSRLVLYAEPQTGIVVWRPSDTETFDKVLQQQPAGAASTTTIAGQRWFRNVAANPNANINLLIAEIQKAL
jgi:L-2,4-diaminobutyrate decarboxylase